MPYTGISFSGLKTQLAERLNDSRVFFSDQELGLHIQDALRFWNILTGENRVNFSLPISVANPVWYDLFQIANSPRLATLTDRDVYLRLTIGLLEPASNIAVVSSSQFVTDDLVQAVQRKRDEFTFRTGCTSTVETLGASGTITLPQTVSQVRRAYWLPTAIPFVTTNPFPLFRGNEFNVASYLPFGPTTPGQPLVFDAGTSPPLSVNIIPPPANLGQVEFLTIESQAALNPGNATTLLIPNDFVPALFWGAMADLLSINLTAQDIQRALLARSRFEEYIALISVYPGVMSARVNGLPVYVDAVETLDVHSPTWRVVTANPSIVGLSGQNLIAFPTNQNMNIILSMVGNANIPVLDNDNIQLGDEILDVILDEAQSTASFKMGGQEAAAALQLHMNIIRLGAQKNRKIKALSCYRDVLYGRVQRENAFASIEVGSNEQQ